MDIENIKGIGSKTVANLKKLNINTIEDLITYYPRDYEDRSKPKRIIDTVNGEEALIEGIVATSGTVLKISFQNSLSLLNFSLFKYSCSEVM